MTEYHLNQSLQPFTPVTCDNCGWEGPAGDLEEVNDLELRLDPGYIVPAGDCPECHRFAYVDEVSLHTLKSLLTDFFDQGGNLRLGNIVLRGKRIDLTDIGVSFNEGDYADKIEVAPQYSKK